MIFVNIEAYDAESLRKLVRLLEYENRLLKDKLKKENIPYESVGDKDGFSGGRCKQMLIPVPPLAEQQRIAEKIDEVLSAMSAAVQFTQNGSLFSRFSQGSQFLVKELVKEK